MDDSGLLFIENDIDTRFSALMYYRREAQQRRNRKTPAPIVALFRLYDFGALMRCRPGVLQASGAGRGLYSVLSVDEGDELLVFKRP